jgi:hypothetical protein
MGGGFRGGAHVGGGFGGAHFGGGFGGAHVGGGFGGTHLGGGFGAAQAIARCSRTRQELNGRAGSTHRQDDFAFGVAGLQVGYRLLGLGERKHAVDDDFKLLGLGERGQIG